MSAESGRAETARALWSKKGGKTHNTDKQTNTVSYELARGARKDIEHRSARASKEKAKKSKEKKNNTESS